MDSFENNFGELEAWIKKNEQLFNQSKDIYRFHELIKLNKTILENKPGVDSLLYNSLHENYNKSLSLLIPNLPKIEPMDPFAIRDTSIALYSGTTASYSEIQAFQPSSSDENKWKYSSIKEYNDFFENKNYIKVISSFFDIIGSKDLNEELIKLVDEYHIYLVEKSDHVTLGFKIRNFIEHFKGILKKAADIETHGKPVKKRDPTWPTMASEIALVTKNNTAFKEFINMGKLWIANHSFLSEESKDFKGNNYLKYCGCYNECILMVYTFTIVVDIDKIKKAI